MTKRFILTTALAVMLSIGVPLSSFADTQLTPVQEAELQRQREQMIAANEGRDGTTPSPREAVKKVNEWVEIGQGVGAGLAGAARELGIVANEFAQTPVGIITISLIVYKVAGGDMVQLLVGFLWMLGVGGTWLFFYRKLWDPLSVETTYHENGKMAGVKRTEHPLGNDDVAVYRLLGLAAGAGVALIGVWITFA